MALTTAVFSTVPRCCSTRRPLRVRAATEGDHKGFGSSKKEPVGSEVQLKVSSRGKVASRPGPSSEKDIRRQRETEREQREEAEAQAKEYNRELEAAKRAGLPEVVSNRMISRVVGFAGVPLVTGFLVFPLFYYLKVLHDPPIDVPSWLALGSSALTFGGAAVGISYGVLSASWNPSVNGSALGLDEFKENVPLFMQRFKND